MNIKVVSIENRTGNALYNMVHKNHEEYCIKNGYDYYEVNDFSKYMPKPTPHWHKFDAVYEVLDSCDWLLWIDFDAIFTNFSTRIESFIPDEGEVVLSKDCNGGRCSFDTGFNNGVMLLKSTFNVKRLFSALKDPRLAEEFNDMQRSGMVHFYDQSAMTYMLAKYECFKKLVKEIPAKSFNSYVKERALVGNCWEEGDFILHLAGFSSSERLQKFSQINRI